MNHDPWIFCFECRRIRKKDDVSPVDPGSKRRACSECRERIYTMREKSKRTIVERP